MCKGRLLSNILRKLEAGPDALLVLGCDRSHILQRLQLRLQLGPLLVQSVRAAALLEAVGDIVGACREQPTVFVAASKTLLLVHFGVGRD